jgi:hypothetical protein
VSASRPASRGVVFVHSAPSALCPHVEWAISGVLRARVDLSWTQQPVAPSTYRAEYSWQGDPGSAAQIASALHGWAHLRFEVTEDARTDVDGARYCHTPRLGIFCAVTGTHGDILVPEDRLKAAMARAAEAGPDGAATLQAELERLLGKPWDDELEAFRHAGDGAPVRWLHQVV